MLLNIISILLNALIFVILNLPLYTDRARMPNGVLREWKRSPISRVNIAGRSALLYLQIAVSAACVITSVLLLLGVKNKMLRTVQIISTIAAGLVFIIIMIVSGDSHANYA